MKFIINCFTILIVLSILLPIFQAILHEKIEGQNIKTSKYFIYSDIEDIAKKMIKVLDGKYAEAAEQTYQTLFEQLNEVYAKRLLIVEQANDQAVEKLIASYKSFYEVLQQKELIFYKQNEQGWNNALKFLKERKLEADVLLAYVKDFNGEDMTNIFQDGQNDLLDKIEIEKKKYKAFGRFYGDLEEAYVAFRLQLSDALETYITVRKGSPKDNTNVKGRTNLPLLDDNSQLSSDEVKSIEEGNDNSIKFHYKINNAKLIGLQDKVALKKAIETAILAAMPPEFCWRGNNPACPSHHPRRSGLLCYRDCEEVHQEDIAQTKSLKEANKMKRYHYNLWGGVCWEQCDQYADERGEEYQSFFLVTCKSKQHWYHWHFKRSFVTSSVTNYNSGAICPEDSKKSWFLGLCYRKCEDFGFVSCGFGACARDPAMCKKHIFLIVGKTILGVAETVLFGLTLGASGAVKEALHLIKSVEEGVASKVVEKLIFNAADLAPKLLEKYETMSTIYKNEILKANILIDCKKKTKILLAGYPQITEETIAEECEKEIEISEQDANSKSNYLTENIIKFTNAKTAKQKLAVIGEASLKVLDFVLLNGIIDTIKKCKEIDSRVASDNQIVECIKGGLAFAANLDPTGIVGLINTFVYPTCRSGLELTKDG